MLRANEWLRLRLIGLIVVLLLGGFGATNLISYRNAVTILKTSILTRELPLTGTNIYSEVQADLIRPVFISSLMANDTFLKDWLLAGEQDPSQVTRYLQAIQEKYGVFTSFLISDRTLRYYHFSGRDRHVSADDPADVWFFRARAMTAPYEINIDHDKASGDTLTIFVNYRLLDYDGRFLAVTGVGLNIESVHRIVERYRSDFQRNVYFVTPAGEVTVTSSDMPRAGSFITALPGISDIARSILDSREGQFEYRGNGDTYLLDTRFIPELGWHVIVEQRQDDATAGLWQGFVINLWVGFTIILVTAAVIAWAVTLYHRRLNVLVTTDKLTGIANRQVFDETIERLIHAGRPFVLMLIDIDDFKRINDSKGHLRGDEVIRTVAQIAIAHLPGAELVCRWGGEEFIAIVRDIDEAEATTVAERLRLAIQQADIETADDGSRVTVSIGITRSHPGDTADTMLNRVDLALYQAKREGRNCVRSASLPNAVAA